MWGVYYDDFYVKTTGAYRVAMEIWWMSSGAYAYEWTGDIRAYSQATPAVSAVRG